MLLTEFLEQTGAKVVAYDIGRRVGAIERADFLAFEQAIRPYPLPMQRKAWFALVQITGDDPQNPLIWFLRLSLDEQGLLVQAERDYLFERLLESAQAHSRGADPQAFLQDNPYAFTPRDDRMALFMRCSAPILDWRLPATTPMHSSISAVRWGGTSGVSSATRGSPTWPVDTAASPCPKQSRSCPVNRWLPFATAWRAVLYRPLWPRHCRHACGRR